MSPPDPIIRPVPTTSDWLRCRKIAREHGRSFYFASRCLPPARRRAALATYAYCRVADDIVDRAQADGPDTTLQAVSSWEAQLLRPTDPVAIAFAHVRDIYGIPLEPVQDLLLGIRMDLTTTRYATWDELRTYCYHVAGTVGLMVAPIFGCRKPDALAHAANLGIAMQLTNILRDVAEDAAMGRLYLPLDEINRFGCDPDAILAGQPGPRFSELMAFQIRRARALYADALCGVPALAPSGRLATLAAAHIYAGILGQIELQEYDVFRTRAHVSSAGKLRTLPRVATSFARLSLFPGSLATPQPLAPATDARDRMRTYG